MYWDAASPGLGVKVTPKGRKVFVVLYRTGGAGSKLRKYTIGPYGRVTLHQARVAAQKVFAAKLEGRDPAAEKREAKRRIVADRVDDLLEAFFAQRLSQNRSAAEISRLLHREVGTPWAGRSIHEIGKRDVVEVISAIEQRGAPAAANKTLKSIKTFLRWCVGRAILDQSPVEGVPLPSKEVARDRVLDDDELAQVILAARKIGGPYGGIDLEVSAFDVAEVAHASNESAETAGLKRLRTPRQRQEADAPSVLLGKRAIPHREGRQAHRQQHYPSIYHSITSSARTRSVSGIVRPSAFAVLTLTTSSNLLGRSMGSSPGFAPARIRAT